MAHKIGWLNQEGYGGETLNPIRARYQGRRGWHCEKAGPDCEHCYAESMNLAGRFGGTKLPYNWESRDKVCVFYDMTTAVKPLRWRKPRAIFWCDMTDLFGDWVPDEWIEAVLRKVRATPQHRHIFLTKRPKRMAKWGLSHAWAGVTAGNQAMADERIPHLLNVKAAVRFVSLEPLLEPLVPLWCQWWWKMLDWLIIGPETGPRRRPCDLKWIRSIVNQGRVAGVPVYVKAVDLGDRVSSDPAEWPEKFPREFPKVGG